MAVGPVRWKDGRGESSKSAAAAAALGYGLDRVVTSIGRHCRLRSLEVGGGRVGRWTHTGYRVVEVVAAALVGEGHGGARKVLDVVGKPVLRESPGRRGGGERGAGGECRAGAERSGAAPLAVVTTVAVARTKLVVAIIVTIVLHKGRTVVNEGASWRSCEGSGWRARRVDASGESQSRRRVVVCRGGRDRLDHRRLDVGETALGPAQRILGQRMGVIAACVLGESSLAAE